MDELVNRIMEVMLINEVTPFINVHCFRAHLEASACFTPLQRALLLPILNTDIIHFLPLEELVVSVVVFLSSV